VDVDVDVDVDINAVVAVDSVVIFASLHIALCL
jgi:hypothetical protein